MNFFHKVKQYSISVNIPIIDRILLSGEKGDKFYIILNGIASVYVLKD